MRLAWDVPKAVTSTRSTSSGKTRRAKSAARLAALTGVLAGHGVMLSLFALAHSEPPPLAEPTVVSVELVRPVTPPPPTPPPVVEPAPEAGGGAPAAPSVVHTPPRPRPVTPEVIAPPVKAPEQPLVVGAAPIATPTPGPGQGGEGDGRGTGTGSGDGSGSGTGCGFPRLLQGPSTRDIVRAAEERGIRARVNAMVNIRCELRADSRLENCRVLSETPAGLGFGEAAVRVATARFRFEVPRRDGQPIARCGIPLGIQFNLGGRAPMTGPLEG